MIPSVSHASVSVACRRRKAVPPLSAKADLEAAEAEMAATKRRCSRLQAEIAAVAKDIETFEKVSPSRRELTPDLQRLVRNGLVTEQQARRMLPSLPAAEAKRKRKTKRKRLKALSEARRKHAELLSALQREEKNERELKQLLPHEASVVVSSRLVFARCLAILCLAVVRSCYTKTMRFNEQTCAVRFRETPLARWPASPLQ